MHWIAHVIREGPGALVGAAVGLAAGWIFVSSGIPNGCHLNPQLGTENLTYLCTSSFRTGLVSAGPLYLISAGGGVLGHALYKKGWS